MTTQSPQKRWGPEGIGYQRQNVWNAIQKYGWENIQHKILESNLTLEEASKKEIYYINYYDSTNPEKGYNKSRGGECDCLIDREVVLDLWRNSKNCIIEIARLMGCNYTTISRILHDNGVTQEEIEDRRCAAIGKAQPIVDREEVIKLWNNGDTIKTITEKMSCSNFTVTTILNEYKIPVKDRMNHNTIKSIDQYTLDDEYIATFESAADAMESLGLGRRGGHIVDVCKGRRKQAYGYKWKYTDMGK